MRETMECRNRLARSALLFGAATLLLLSSCIGFVNTSPTLPVSPQTLPSGRSAQSFHTDQDILADVWKPLLQVNSEARLNLAKAEYERRRSQTALNSAPDDPEWISLGPTNGAGKMNAVAIHPTMQGTFYAGADIGGLWKTTDDGTTWNPLTDSIPALAVGALAIAPSSPDTLYLGTGRPGMPGIGLLKSTDGGNTWLFPQQVIASDFARISVAPNDPNEVVIATGEGGFRSVDGGVSWSKVISIIPTYDVERSPLTPNVLYATAGIFGPTRLLKSTDWGVTWIEKKYRELSSTSPQTPRRMLLAVSPSNPLVVYASTSDDAQNSNLSHIYKSTDAGESWKDLPGVVGNSNPSISHFHAAFGIDQSSRNSAIAVSPTNENTVIAGGILYIRSTDGGVTWQIPTFRGGGIHVDVTDIKYHGARLYTANDGGVWSSPDDGETTTDLNSGLVTRQYYSVAIDSRHKARLIAGSQDNGTDIRTDLGGGDWVKLLGGDGGPCAISTVDSSTAYATAFFPMGIVRTRNFGEPAAGWVNVTPILPAGELLFPLIMELTPPSNLYVVSYRVWRTRDGGDSWEPLPTLMTDGSTWETRNDITDLAVAPSNDSVIMIAKGGKLLRSDNGVSWTNVSPPPPPVWVNSLSIDPKDFNTVYAHVTETVQGQDRFSIYKTTDGGLSWVSRVASGLRVFPLNKLRVDPFEAGVLYCATAFGLYRSIDEGGSWSKFGDGLPSTWVTDIRFFDDRSMIRVATCGRGIWEARYPQAKPQITGIAVSGKKLFVFGTRFDNGAVILINGDRQKTINDDQSPSTTLVGKKAGRRIRPGDRVQVLNSSGAASDEFVFTP